MLEQEPNPSTPPIEEAPKNPGKIISENEKAKLIPKMLEALLSAGKIKYLVTDADNNLWDWVKMHALGMHKMACALCSVTELSYEEIQQSMKRVYMAARTLDFSNLVESMDVIQAYAAIKAETIMLENEEDTQRARATMQANIVAELTIIAKKAYDKSKEENFELYPGIEDVFKLIVENRIQLIILTDAPYHKTEDRLRTFGLDKNVTKMFGQVQKPLRFDHDVQFSDEEQYLKPYFEAIKAIIPYRVNYSERARVVSGDLKMPFPCVILDENECKPHISLSRRLFLTPQQVREEVAVWGDNATKDGRLAIYNEVAAYLHSDYGQTRDFETIDRLTGFGSTQEVKRNLSAGDESLEQLKQEQEERITKLIQKHRVEIRKLTHSIQAGDALGLGRPAGWETEEREAA